MNPFENAFGVFYMCFYTFSMLQQIFYSCYYGNEIILKFKELGTKLFHTKWTRVYVKYRHEFIFFLMKSNVVQNYKAGKIPINLSTFGSVSKISHDLSRIIDQFLIIDCSDIVLALCFIEK